MIDTSSTPAEKKNKKINTYKGVKIQNDNEEEVEELKKSDEDSSSGGSADDYFNQ